MRVPLALLSLAALALAGCASSGTTVRLVDSAFQPNGLTVAHGVAVHFQNTGQLQHTVTIHDDAGHVLLDKVLDPGAAVDFTFPAAGDYHVFCRYHADQGMQMPVQAT